MKIIGAIPSGREIPDDLLPGPEPPLSDAFGPVIPVSGTRLDGNELAYLRECVDSNWISSGGPFVGRFERAFAAAAGCAEGVATSSGTAALHLALAALGVGAGDEVIVPAFTMIATANAATYLGAAPVPVDAEPRTGNIDPARIAARITRRTRAIVVVHTYGHPADMEAIDAVASPRGIPVVEDAAEAHGARIGERPVGSFGRMACFSFYGNKIVSTGEGGMVTTDDRALAGRVRLLRDHAFSPDRHFWHATLGYNYRMTNLQAAVGLAQTERLASLVAARRENARDYAARLAGIPGLALPVEEPGFFSVFWMYALRVEPEFGMTRDALRVFLAGRGIETRSFFVPIHLQPVYARWLGNESHPVAEDLCRRGLYLPSGPGTSAADRARVAAAIAEAAAR